MHSIAPFQEFEDFLKTSERCSEKMWAVTGSSVGCSSHQFSYWYWVSNLSIFKILISVIIIIRIRIIPSDTKCCNPTSVAIKMTFFQIIVVSSVAGYSGISDQEYKYPWWAEVIGFVLAASSVLCIPGTAIYYLIITEGSFREVKIIPPNSKHFPVRME